MVLLTHVEFYWILVKRVSHDLYNAENTNILEFKHLYL
jgi:hypothetical protein